MEIIRDGLRGDIMVPQSKYTEEVLKRWGMTHCKPAATPWASGTILNKCEKECKDIDAKDYQSLIGALMYLVVISRPDSLSPFNSHPHKEHL